MVNVTTKSILILVKVAAGGDNKNARANESTLERAHGPK